MMSIIQIILMVVGAVVLIAVCGISYLAWYIWKMGQFEYKPVPKANEGS